MRLRSFSPMLLVATPWISACVDSGIEAIQYGEAWVFAYTTAPSGSNEALQTAAAAVEGGCLQVGDSVVVWRQEHLATVEEIVDAIEAGAAPMVSVGGGGQSLDEGSTLDDFPDVVVEHCSPRVVWSAGHEAPTVTDGG